MRILYHYHHYNPRIEAVAQEIEVLKEHFQGALFLANQNRFIPDWLKLKFKEKHFDLHHIYHPTLVLRPFLKNYLFKLKKPVVLSIASSPFAAGTKEDVLDIKEELQKLGAIIVSDQESYNQLQKIGLTNVSIVRTGINLNRFQVTPVISSPILKIVMASSPHSEEGFILKGVDLLLKTLREINQIKVYFLWRHKLEKQFWQLVDRYGVRDKVELIEGPINPNQFLSDKQGMIVPYLKFASNKAYPHSIIDALASGRAVLTSNVVPISEIVQKERCGVVFKPEVASLQKAIENFRLNFSSLSKNARPTAEKYFSAKDFIQSYQKVYQKVLNQQ